MERTAAGTLGAKDIGSRVLLQAWVHRRRDHGALTFFNLRDRSGVVQVTVHREEAPEVATALERARLEWVVEIEGTVAARAPEAVNPEMATGEIEVIAERAVVLSESDPLPFTVDGGGDGTVEATEETRLRYRYLDLRRHELQQNLLLRSRVVFEIRRYFHDRGFVDLETPILTRSTPEGARDYLVPSRVHPGNFYALPQSPQIFKQLTMVSGFEKYIQIARCFRDEDLRADRQPEFTQVDVELSFPTEETIYELIEGLFGQIFPTVGIATPERFPRLTYREAMRRFGTDRPDLRFGLEIADLSAVLGDSSFRAFQSTVADGGVVRGFAVPGAAGASRKQIDGWAEVARRAGAAGALWLKRVDGELRFQVKKVLGGGELSAAAEALGLEEGGLGLIVAASEEVAAAALGALRVELARAFDLIPAERFEFVWITEFPLVEWNEEEERWNANHHPFTMPDERDLDRLKSDPRSVRTRAYDVVLNGLELGGGSIRIHRADLQERVFKVLGIEAAEARERFGFLLDALRYGAPPHGGIALGLDRMVMLMARAASIRDVIAFPKTASAVSLMTGAPGVVDPQQLEELGLTIKSSAAEPDEGSEAAS